MMSVRDLKTAAAGCTLVVTKVNEVEVVSEEYNQNGVSLDVHKVVKMVPISTTQINIEIVGGTGRPTQGFKRRESI